MKAFLFTEYGSPDVLHLRDIPKPAPKEGEVLVKVHAVSINDWDWLALHGTPFMNRMMFGLVKPKRQILGSDIAGRIEALGSNTRTFHVGDEVFGDLSGTWGGFAEYVCARETALALKPPAMTFEQAAAIPQAAMLAVQGLRDTGNLQSGQKLLINGAGGGVGTFAIQLARLYGAEVTGVDSLSKHDLMRSLGASHVIDYAKEDFTKRGERYDLILDVKTDRSIFDYARVLKPDGMYATVGGSTARILQAFLVWPWMRRFRVVMLKTNKDLEYMKELFAAGSVLPVIDGPYAFEELPDAMRHFGAGRHKGKVVVTL